METVQNDITNTGGDDVTSNMCVQIRSLSANNSEVEVVDSVGVTTGDVIPVNGDYLTDNNSDGPSSSSESVSEPLTHATIAEATQAPTTISDSVNRTSSIDQSCVATCSSDFFVLSSQCHQTSFKSNSLSINNAPSMFLPVRHPCNTTSASNSVAQRLNNFVTPRVIPSFDLKARYLAVQKAGSAASALNCYYVCPQNPSPHCNSQLTDVAAISHLPANYLPASQLSLNGTNAMRFTQIDDLTCGDVGANGRTSVVPAGTWMCGLNGSVLGQSLSVRSVIGMSVTNIAPQNHATYIRDVTIAQNPSSCSDHYIRFAAKTGKTLDSQSPACMQSKDIDWPTSNQSEATHASQLTESLKSLDPVSKAVYENFWGKLTAPKSRNNRRRNHNLTRR